MATINKIPRTKCYLKIPTTRADGWMKLLDYIGIRWPLNGYHKKFSASLLRIEAYNRAIRAFNYSTAYCTYRSLMAQYKYTLDEITDLDYQLRLPELLAEKLDHKKQLHAYLITIPITDKRLEISDKKKALLIANGIINSADVGVVQYKIKGLGGTMKHVLHNWQWMLKGNFIYRKNNFYVATKVLEIKDLQLYLVQRKEEKIERLLAELNLIAIALNRTSLLFDQKFKDY